MWLMGLGLWDFGWVLGLDSDFGAGSEGRPQGLKPLSFFGSMRAKPEGLAYLEARARARAKAKARAKQRQGQSKGKGKGKGKARSRFPAGMTNERNNMAILYDYLTLERATSKADDGDSDSSRQNDGAKGGEDKD